MELERIFRKVFLFLFVLSCIIFPASDIILSKKILFAINILLFCIEFCMMPKKPMLNCNEFIRTFVILLIPLTFSIFTDSVTFNTALFFMITVFTLLITFPAHQYAEEYFRYFMISANILAVLTLFLSYNYLTSGWNIWTVIYNLLNSGFIGIREFSGIRFTMVHFRTAPIFIISFSLYFISFINKPQFKNLFLLLLHGLAIFFTASRGIMLFAFISVLMISFYERKRFRYAIIFDILFITVIFGIIYILLYTNLFSVSEKSNSIKIGHFNSFIQFINDDPLILLWGKGTGSAYYTEGFKGIYSQTELTYLDMIRYFGIPVTILFVLCMAFPTRHTVLSVPFLLYYIDAATNPLIFCSTGMLIISMYFVLQNNFKIDEIVPKFDTKWGKNVFKYNPGSL